MRRAVNCANLMVIYVMHSLVEYVAGSSAFKAYNLNLTADDQCQCYLPTNIPLLPYRLLFFSLTPHPT